MFYYYPLTKRQLWPVGLFCSPWPEQALRANIHCQISLALNRIYTEWYPSKGYSFNITNSTSYDQYYVHGRTVFDVMVRLTDDIFNTYIRKTGTVNPYYAEYCDGKSVTCPGLKQWGTVTLANQGRNALSILKYYYGNNIEIIRTNNIQSIPQSYPGSPLRQGSTGAAVFTLQRQLNRITKDYPFLGLLTVDGIFGRKMTETVKKFQKQFNLTADGVVGRSTWYKISYIYVSVKDLAELTSEGETFSGTLSDGSWNFGSSVLKQGSTGSEVEQVQFWLSTLAQYESSIPSVTVDGVYGSGTAAAVRAFQRLYGLTVDGIVGRTTWTELYDQFRSIQSDNGTPNAYPGTALRQGSSGQNVRLVQFWLKIARTVYSSLNNVTVDGIFGSSTAAAVRRFQTYFGLTSDGVVGRTTWNKLYEVYNDIANRLLSPSLRPGVLRGPPFRLRCSPPPLRAYGTRCCGGVRIPAAECRYRPRRAALRAGNVPIRGVSGRFRRRCRCRRTPDRWTIRRSLPSSRRIPRGCGPTAGPRADAGRRACPPIRATPRG